MRQLKGELTVVANAYDTVDLYGVLRDREQLLEKTQSPYFREWWPQFLAAREAQLEKPVLSEVDGPRMSRAAAAQGEHYDQVSAASREMVAQAFAYALTGNERWSERARQIALVICDEAEWDNPVHRWIYPELHADLGFATLCVEMSMTLGWLGEFLSPADRERILNTLEARGGVIYADAQKGAWWGSAYNSNWTSHLMHGLGAAALALLPSMPEVARPRIEFVTDRMGRMLELAGEEGAGLEGISYYMGCYASILEYATELRNVTGESLFDYDFWGKSALFPLYQTLPDLSGRTPIGDSHYPSLSGSILLSGLAREAWDGVAQWQAHRVFEGTSGRNVLDLIFYDPSVQETPPDDLPPCRLFRSVQLATFRSGWDRDAVYMHFHGGSNSWSHCHLDLNAFTIAAYGERLAIDHGSWGYSPHYFKVVEPQISTAWHNCVVVDGGDQRQAPRYRMSYDPREGGDCYSLLEQYVHCDGIQMIRGDATTAYGDTLDRCWREIVFLPPDRFVVYDNLLTNGARVQRHLQWMLHSAVPMRDAGTHVEVQGEKAKLIVQPVHPTDWTVRFPDRLSRAAAYQQSEIREAYAMSLYPEWVHIWNESPSKPPYPQWEARGGKRVYGPDYQFLVVLSPVRAEQSIGWQLTPLKGDTIEGVVITEGQQVDTVVFKRSGGLYTIGEVQSDAEKVVVREVGGQVRALAMVNGTQIAYKGQVLLSASEPTSLALDLNG